MEIEICVEKVETALAANKLGVDRIELCSALDLGGLTPSTGLIETCSEKCSLDIYTMIRPRGGKFDYTSEEINIMIKNIKAAKKAGTNGVVFGCLNENFTINKFNTKVLFEEAKSLNLGVTFHRAFDFVPNSIEAIDFLIELGFERILTSGQKPTAIEGLKNIQNFVTYSNGRIQIMAGSGVNSTNVNELIQAKVDAIHFTARKEISIEDSLNMGKEYESDITKIKTIKELLNN